MTGPKAAGNQPRLALTRKEAAESLGVGLTYFEENIQPDLRVVRLSGKVLIPVSELEWWVARHAEPAVAWPGTHKTARRRRQRPGPDTGGSGSDAHTTYRR